MLHNASDTKKILKCKENHFLVFRNCIWQPSHSCFEKYSVVKLNCLWRSELLTKTDKILWIHFSHLVMFFHLIACYIECVTNTYSSMELRSCWVLLWGKCTDNTATFGNAYCTFIMLHCRYLFFIKCLFLTAQYMHQALSMFLKLPVAWFLVLFFFFFLC